MNTYRVKHDFSKSQPMWGSRERKLYGPANQGYAVEANTPDEAVKTFADKHNLNPFYLVAVEA
jgi:hypothetical protein